MHYLTVPLGRHHNRSHFSCGHDSLNHYIKTQANQDMKRRLAVVFVYLNTDNMIIGYYTLSNCGIDRDLLPDALIQKIPHSYHHMPLTLLERLAIDKHYQGQKIGQRLLIDALKRSTALAKIDIGSMGVVVDPIDDKATAFYKHFGFIMLPERGRMFLPMKTIEQIF